MEPAVQQYLIKLPDNKSEAALYIRDLIILVDPLITDCIKWRTLTFNYKKTSFAFIYTFPTVDYINLAFFKAVELDDPKKLFEGTGKGMRHIKVWSVKDIPATQIKKWVKEATHLI